ncbi:MAG TPA: PAS domain S-box protein [Phycisphaerales bacterium]|nr:PAS domain S-box protein [Phycisphaerales bacterium]
MSDRDRINILLVDDRLGSLPALEAILGELDETLLNAQSVDDALRHLLTTDIALVLINASNPALDGFELAETIRRHPRYHRTAIMFLSAVHLADQDKVRAYALGAVDFLESPVIPQVLRAKVSVFTELYRKTRQLEHMNSELELRVADRTADLEASAAKLRTSERRYRDLVQGLSAAVYTCDNQGRITLYNQAAADLWGQEPVVGQTMWCGAFRAFNADGSPVKLDDCPMAAAIRRGEPVPAGELIIERPDGSRRYVKPSPKPMWNDDGQIIGAVNLLEDITDTKAAESVRTLLAAIVASSDDAILSKTLDGTITSWNAGAQRMFGYAPEEVVARSIFLIVPQDQHDTEREILARIGRGEHIKHFETSRVTKDGRVISISLSISPVRDASGAIVGASAVSRDISERKKAEAILARDREELERLVQERTAELELSNQRLRTSDRLAMIGTLAAGLGHDMGNLLLPIRMRLDAMDAMEIPHEIKEDLAAIRQASEYLQKLAASLRLLSLDAHADRPGESSTRLALWWPEAAAMIRNSVPRSVALSADIPASLPAVSVGPAALTQMLFNLVQNAGDALRNVAGGRIDLAASFNPSTSRILITVRDNGPGMTDEARRRCLEPFFTTKTRGLSTGLGLSLVNSLVKSCGGQISLDTSPGAGTLFTLELPALKPAEAPPPVLAPGLRHAFLTMADARLAAHGQWVLRSMGYEVGRDTLDSCTIWVTDGASPFAHEKAVQYLNADKSRRVVVLDDRPCHAHAPQPPHDNPRLTYIGRGIKPSAMKNALIEALRSCAEVSAE